MPLGITVTQLLTRRRSEELSSWMTAVEAGDLPALHGFVRGLRKNLAAVTAGLSVPYSNGPAEGVNNKIKMLERQMYGRAGFALLRRWACPCRSVHVGFATLADAADLAGRAHPAGGLR